MCFQRKGGKLDILLVLLEECARAWLTISFWFHPVTRQQFLYSGFTLLILHNVSTFFFLLFSFLLFSALVSAFPIGCCLTDVAIPVPTIYHQPLESPPTIWYKGWPEKNKNKNRDRRKGSKLSFKFCFLFSAVWHKCFLFYFKHVERCL